MRLIAFPTPSKVRTGVMKEGCMVEMGSSLPSNWHGSAAASRQSGTFDRNLNYASAYLPPLL